MPSRVGIGDGRPEEGGAEVCFTPGKAPIGKLADPWKQPLKGQLPPQHVKGPLGKEPSEAARRSEKTSLGLWRETRTPKRISRRPLNWEETSSNWPRVGKRRTESCAV